MMYWYGGPGGWGFWGSLIGMIGLTAVILGTVVFLLITIARVSRPEALRRSEPHRPEPEEMLAERFARGEIDEHGYERALEVLRGQRGGT